MKLNYEERFLEIENHIYELLSSNEFELLTKHDIIYQKLKTLNKSIKEHVFSNGFANFDEEVHFFKNIKPNIYAWFKTLNYIKKMEAKFMVLDAKMSVELIDVEYGKYKKYLLKNSYIPVLREKGVEYDMIHFTQLSKKKIGVVPVLDDEYSCLMGLKLEKFYRRKFYIVYLVNKKKSILNNNSHMQNFKKIKWTGTIADYVEMVYALVVSKAINNGNITFKELHEKLSMVIEFEKEIDIHNTMNEIKRRKNNPTKFLDKLSNDLDDYINR